MASIPEIDNHIIRQCQTRDADAFRSLVMAYTNYVYALAYRILWNEQDAEDVVQETFFRVWKSIKRFEVDRKFSTWLYTIVTNLCRDNLRKRKRKNENEVPRDCQRPAREVNDDLSNLTLDIVKQLAAGLPDTQRIVFVLRDLQDIPIRDVALILSTTENAVKSNLYYARKALREKYKQINS